MVDFNLDDIEFQHISGGFYDNDHLFASAQAPLYYNEEPYTSAFVYRILIYSGSWDVQYVIDSVYVLSKIPFLNDHETPYPPTAQTVVKIKYTPNGTVNLYQQLLGRGIEDILISFNNLDSFGTTWTTDASYFSEFIDGGGYDHEYDGTVDYFDKAQSWLKFGNDTVSFVDDGFPSAYQVGSGHLVFNYEIFPIPEPETYAMLLVGLGVVSVAARRRNRAVRA